MQTHRVRNNKKTLVDCSFHNSFQRGTAKMVLPPARRASRESIKRTPYYFQHIFICYNLVRTISPTTVSSEVLCFFFSERVSEARMPFLLKPNCSDGCSSPATCWSPSTKISPPIEPLKRVFERDPETLRFFIQTRSELQDRRTRCMSLVSQKVQDIIDATPPPPDDWWLPELTVKHGGEVPFPAKVVKISGGRSGRECMCHFCPDRLEIVASPRFKMTRESRKNDAKDQKGAFHAEYGVPGSGMRDSCGTCVAFFKNALSKRCYSKLAGNGTPFWMPNHQILLCLTRHIDSSRKRIFFC